MYSVAHLQELHSPLIRLVNLHYDIFSIKSAAATNSRREAQAEVDKAHGLGISNGETKESASERSIFLFLFK